MTPEQIATLQTELTTDPLARGYAGMTDVQACVDLNAPTRSQALGREWIDACEFLARIDKTEYAALSAANKAVLNLYLGCPRINLRDEAIRADFAAMFGAGTATRTAILALQGGAVIVSRATELGLPYVYPADVAEARA